MTMRILATLLCAVALSACGNAVSNGDKPADPTSSETAAPEMTAFTADEDCAPATCCHATECVLKDKEPNCAEVACTRDCRPGTMDCGRGHCLCDAGKCRAEIKPEPELAPETTPDALAQ